MLTGNEGIADSRWDSVMKEAKVSGSDEISLEEFIIMMKSLLGDQKNPQ